jgi:diguanylate cyclase (GGDEF)-like protein
MKTPFLVRLQFVIKLTGTVAVVAYWISNGTLQIRQYWFIALLIFALEAETQKLPFAVFHDQARNEFSADMMVIVAAALLLPTQVGSLAVSAGYAFGFVLRREANLGRLDDITSQVISAYLALTIAHIVGPPGLGPMSIVASAVAALVYDPSGLFLIAMWSVLAKRNNFWLFFWPGLVASAGTYPWLMCLGILLGVVGWDAPWALPLMAAPLALVLMASRSRVRATEDRFRLDGVLKATTQILGATTADAVKQAVAASATTLFENSAARMDAKEPAEGELGVRLVTERAGTWWLTLAAPDTLMPRNTEQDQLMLETLASVTASALDKAVLHEDVTEQATRDALTGLANRRAFENELQSSVFGQRSTDASGVIFLDLDGFKSINDEHGHKAGDEVLVETAKRLLESVRGGDMVARLGGDEFTVLLHGIHSKDEAIVVADRILAAMRQPIQLSVGASVHPTPSLGIALADRGDTDPATLLKDADKAMYAAKRAGKDCWRLVHEDVVMAS